MRKAMCGAALLLGARGTALCNITAKRLDPLDLTTPPPKPIEHAPCAILSVFKSAFKKMGGGGDLHPPAAAEKPQKTPINVLHTTSVRWRLTF